MQRQGAYFILVVTMRDNLELLDTETQIPRESENCLVASLHLHGINSFRLRSAWEG